MRSRNMSFTSALIVFGALFTVGAVTAPAAVPSLVNYQGILNNPGGTPQVGTFSVTFTIYPVPAGGSVIWTEVQSVTTSAAGLFNVLLGSATPITDAVFSGPDRYLSTAVSPDPEMTPRTRIATVAYAFRPATVDGATGGTISGNTAIQSDLTVSGNVGVGTTSPAAKLNVLNGTIRVGSQLGSAGIEFYPALAGTPTNAGSIAGVGGSPNAIAIMPVGNVGIGTTSPAAKLDVVGDLKVSGNVTLDPSTATSGNILKGGVPFIHNFGADNTFIGLNAGNLTLTGSGNTASGTSALANNTNGTNNTAFGMSALLSNTHGASNTACGVSALLSNVSDVNTAFGQSALKDNTDGNHNTALGAEALIRNIDGIQNTAVGYQAMKANFSGTNNTGIGYRANASSTDLVNATAVGANATVNASNKIRLGDANVTVIEGQVAYTFPSDSTQKENFQPVDGDEVLRKIRDWNLRSWNYIGNDPQQFRHYGPMAQEFFAAFGHDAVGTSGTPTTINSGDEAGILMVAVQALEKRTTEVDAIKAENQNLQAQIAELRAMMAAMHAKQEKTAQR